MQFIFWFPQLIPFKIYPKITQNLLKCYLKSGSIFDSSEQAYDYSYRIFCLPSERMLQLTFYQLDKNLTWNFECEGSIYCWDENRYHLTTHNCRIDYLQVADLSIIKHGFLSNEAITGYILKWTPQNYTYYTW